MRTFRIKGLLLILNAIIIHKNKSAKKCEHGYKSEQNSVDTAKLQMIKTIIVHNNIKYNLSPTHDSVYTIIGMRIVSYYPCELILNTFIN